MNMYIKLYIQCLFFPIYIYKTLASTREHIDMGIYTFIHRKQLTVFQRTGWTEDELSACFCFSDDDNLHRSSYFGRLKVRQKKLTFLDRVERKVENALHTKHFENKHHLLRPHRLS